MKRNYFILLIFLLAIFNTKIRAQHVDAGDDVYLCPGETTATLHADVDCSVKTGTYTVEAIQFQWDRDLTNTENVLDVSGNPLRIDDRYSQVIDLPFPISFFGNSYDQMVVGSNGDLIFEPSIAGELDTWVFTASQLIPDHTLPYWDSANNLSYAAVLGPYYDIDISVPYPTEELRYKVEGVAPNRKFTVMYLDIPLYSFSCNNLLANQEIIFYESDCSIEVHVKDRPSCPTWQYGKRAVLGIQNDELNPDTCGYYPGDATSPTLPNRNNGEWVIDEMNPEAYRFKPDGNLTVRWLDANGNVIGTGVDIEVEPSEDTEYTVEITYEDCHGNSTTEMDTVTVYVIPEAVLEMPEDDIICEGDTYTFDGTLANASDYDSVDYTWTDSAGNVVSNNAVIEATQGGDYSLSVVTHYNGSTCSKDFGSFNLKLYEACKIPEGISPNGDGLNDAFILDYYAGEYGIDTFQVFDRRGVLLYEKDNYVREFVGKDNDGNDLPAATYYYVLKLLNGDKYTGWFQLIR